jgi:hypothetical protein
MYKLGLGYHGRSKEQMTIDGLIGGKKRMELLSEEERIELALKGGLETWKLGLGIHGRSKKQMTLDSRKGVEAQGNFLWSLEHVLDIHNFREESIGKGFHSTKPSLDYVRDKMNEKYDKNWSTKKVEMAYHNNKDKLPDEEE